MSPAANVNEYMLARYRVRVAAAREQLGGQCAVCGSTDQLEFDHIDPSTKWVNLPQMWGYSEARFQGELAKCQLLCRVHHAEKTARENGQALARGTHGTLSAYRYCGPPKCDDCKLAKRDWQRQRRATSGRNPIGMGADF